MSVLCRILLIAYCVLGKVAAGFCAEARLGRLELAGPDVVLLGTYPNTEDRTARVRIRNAGSGPLRIERVVTTCKCMRVDAYPRALDAGQEGEVAVTVMKNEVTGPFERVFIVDSNDPVNRSVRVKIIGEAKPLFRVTCDAPTALGPISPGLVWTGRFEVAATEPGVFLDAPAVRARGARCEFTIQTNRQVCVRYEVKTVVVFEGGDVMESALTFPVRRTDGRTAFPVRLEVAGVLRRPIAVVPDRISVPRSVEPVKRRLLVTLDAGAPPDPGQLQVNSGLESVHVTVQPSQTGKGLLVELLFPPASIERLYRSGGSVLSLSYSGRSVDVPLRAGN